MNQRTNIAFVNPPLSEHKFRGTGVYAQELLRFLKKDSRVRVEQINIYDNLDNFGLVHYPYFDPFFLTLPLIKKKPTAVTVHDLIPLKFPKYFPPGIRGRVKWEIQKIALSVVDAVITDSYASKEDIVSYTNVSKEKIKVIYLGVGEAFKAIKTETTLSNINSKLKLPKDFILHVGDVNYNKNIPNLIRAFELISKSYPRLHLFLIGNGFKTESEQLREIVALINKLGISNRIHRVGFLPLADLIGIYSMAKVYLHPSFAEGFGLPVLEAMACGCPVVVSNISSLPELVGEAGIKVDPNNIKSIANGIYDILVDDSTRRELIMKGLERARLFTWEKTANLTIESYLRLLNKK